MRDSLEFPTVDFTSLSLKDQQSYLHDFSQFIWEWYNDNKRLFDWRETSDPYRILLSELMLQQTQTERVVSKYNEFLTLWPTFEDMAQSTLTDVLFAWKGLGYNRRAMALRTIASKSESFGYTLPDDYQTLLTFPMIGEATAAAILSFSYNKKAIYLETNIRRVIIHHFFTSEEDVRDKDIKGILSALIEEQDDVKNWYYALMDYGVMIKKMGINPNRRSRHYHKQKPFENSNRQIRSLLLHTITVEGEQQREDLLDKFSFEPERIITALDQLEHEGFIEQSVKEKIVHYCIKENR